MDTQLLYNAAWRGEDISASLPALQQMVSTGDAEQQHAATLPLAAHAIVRRDTEAYRALAEHAAYPVREAALAAPASAAFFRLPLADILPILARGVRDPSGGARYAAVQTLERVAYHGYDLTPILAELRKSLDDLRYPRSEWTGGYDAIFSSDLTAMDARQDVASAMAYHFVRQGDLAGLETLCTDARAWVRNGACSSIRGMLQDPEDDGLLREIRRILAKADAM